METKLFVGNLSYETTENDLRSLFSQAGTVNEVALIQDRDTGSSKGFAFVTMGSQKEADMAIAQFNGQILGSREMRVNVALSREERPRSNFDSNWPGGYSSNTQNRGGGRRF
jgi:RNA recognition motif-containing protein